MNDWVVHMALKSSAHMLDVIVDCLWCEKCKSYEKLQEQDRRIEE